jgi:uncharacterized protein YjbI with pentapeptide repeats
MDKIYNRLGKVICEDRSLQQVAEDNKLFNKTGGKKGIRANLTGANLRNASLTNADLTKADLRYVSLRNANLTDADLTNADLTGANLSYADLTNANLTDADLTNADLTGANLTNANLTNADLTDADLRYVNLRCADLTCANLSYANLRNADLTNANLRNADLTGAELVNADLSGAKLDLQIQEGLLQEIGKVILSNPEKLQMKSWHGSCGTTHCLSGWAEEFNPITKELVKTHGNEIAGLLTLGIEAHSYFFKSDVEVLGWLETVIK